MNTNLTVGAVVVWSVVLALTLALLSDPAIAQDVYNAAFEAKLLDDGSAEAHEKGSVHGWVSGDTLRLLVVYGGLNASSTASIAASLYRGNPTSGTAEYLRNLSLSLGPTGGFDSEFVVTEQDKEDLQDGLLYVHVRTENEIPGVTLVGQLQLSSATDFMETRLSHISQGYPTTRGGRRAMHTSEGLRLIGYFNGLTSNWVRVSLYRGPAGGAGEHVTSIYNLNPSIFHGGIDQVVELDPGTWEDALQQGQLSVVVETSRASDVLRGRFLSKTNRPPDASQLITPSDGEIIVIGGTGGQDPVPPDAMLGEVTLSPVTDPDGDPVSYIWQLSLRPQFNSADLTTTLELGVDSTTVPMSVARAAALYDVLAAGAPGGVEFGTAVTVYHRVLTTDGSSYRVGTTTETSFLRGAITSNESDNNLPGAITLHGNYPNPFACSTTLSFDLPEQAEVRIEVFNLLGQRVLDVPAGWIAAGSRRDLQIDAVSLSPGNYLYRIVAQGNATVTTASGSMTILR